MYTGTTSSYTQDQLISKIQIAFHIYLSYDVASEGV